MANIGLKLLQMQLIQDHQTDAHVLIQLDLQFQDHKRKEAQKEFWTSIYLRIRVDTKKDNYLKGS